MSHNTLIPRGVPVKIKGNETKIRCFFPDVQSFLMNN